MGEQMNFIWNWILLFTIIVSGNCIPLEVVYTGEGCDCAQKLPYEIKVPSLPKPKPYKPLDIGYKVDVPVAPTKVSYSFFDFTVEEPKTPKPPMPKKLDLYAKVDRIALHKADCPPTYEAPLLPAALPAPCSCSSCGLRKPIYRYVHLYKNIPQCNCQRPNCKCNLTPPNAMYPTETDLAMVSDEFTSNNQLRQKRDLRRRFFRQRKVEPVRTNRFVKLYNRSLPEKPKPKPNGPIFGGDFFEPLSQRNKRKMKKFHSRLVKRDIKGEFDMLENERNQMDLTIPEIVQYMPETLRANFKRGPCPFSSCAQQEEMLQQYKEQQQQAQQQEERREIGTETHEGEEASSMEEEKQDMSHSNPLHEGLYYQRAESSKNSINSATATSNSYTKRNAADYKYENPSTTVPHHNQPTKPQLPLLYPQKNAYGVDQQALFTNPPYTPSSQQTQQRSDDYPQTAQSLQFPAKFYYDRLGQKYNAKSGPISNGKSSHEPDILPLKYIGDLDGKIPHDYEKYFTQNPTVNQAHHYPVQYIPNDRLDRIIKEIVYKHPDFIDATSHYGGALVDPEPYQAKETKDFLKKLITGRLSNWFNESELDSSPLPFDPFNPYGASAPLNPFSPYKK